MKIAVVHPIRHHAYYALQGALNVDATAELFAGYYDNNDIIDRLLKKTKWKWLVAGYHMDALDGHVRTNKIIKLLFLLFKLCPSVFEKLYINSFQRWCIHHLQYADMIYVLQDYCNDVIRWAKENHKKILYDQILAFHFSRYITGCDGEIEGRAKLDSQIWNLKNADMILSPSDFVTESISEEPFYSEIADRIRKVCYGGDVSRYIFHRKNFKGGG